MYMQVHKTESDTNFLSLSLELILWLYPTFGIKTFQICEMETQGI